MQPLYTEMTLDRIEKTPSYSMSKQFEEFKTIADSIEKQLTASDGSMLFRKFFDIEPFTHPFRLVFGDRISRTVYVKTTDSRLLEVGKREPIDWDGQDCIMEIDMENRDRRIQGAGVVSFNAWLLSVRKA